MRLHFHPSTNNHQSWVPVLQGVIAYWYGNLPMVSIMWKILLQNANKNTHSNKEHHQITDRQIWDILPRKVWTKLQLQTCKLTSHSLLRLESKHMTDQPDVTTTKTCLALCPGLTFSITPVAIATARLPEEMRILSGKRLTSVRTRALLNPSSTRLLWGSKI